MGVNEWKIWARKDQNTLDYNRDSAGQGTYNLYIANIILGQEVFLTWFWGYLPSSQELRIYSCINSYMYYY